MAIWLHRALGGREIEYLRSHTRTMDEVAAFSPGWLLALTEVDVPRQLSAARLTGNMCRMIGVRPMLGTTFGMESEATGSAPVVVLGYDLWRSTFRGACAADRHEVGRRDARVLARGVRTNRSAAGGSRSSHDPAPAGERAELGANIGVEGRPISPHASMPRAAWQSVSTKFFATVYVSFEQHSVRATSLVVRYTGDATMLAPAIRSAIWSVRRDVPVDETRTMDAVLSRSLQRPRLILQLLGFFTSCGWWRVVGCGMR